MRLGAGASHAQQEEEVRRAAGAGRAQQGVVGRGPSPAERGAPVSKTYVNVEIDQAGEARIQAEEQSWSGRRLILLGAVLLPMCFALLYALANLTTWLGTHQP